jgi:hypothetical protein
MVLVVHGGPLLQGVAVLKTSSDLCRVFREACRSADEMWIASAWATTACDVAGSISRRRDCLRAFVVGLDFHQTDPEILRRFGASVRVLRVPGVFHPKAYLFRQGSKFVSIVGSSNLTVGGFGVNAEVNLVVRGRTDNPLYEALRRTIENLWDRARTLRKVEIEDYARAYARLRSLRARLTRFTPARQTRRAVRALVRRERLGLKPPESLQVPWVEFERLLLAQERDRKRGLRVRMTPAGPSFLSVSQGARKLFNTKRTLARMAWEERRQVAGLHGHHLYFGAMRAAGAFQKILRQSPGRLDKALDTVPRRGEVTRRQFDHFFRKLPAAGVGIGTATRLLAMKRPDRFLCVNDGNIPRLSAHFGVTQASLQEFEGYWNLLTRVWRCDWFFAPRPRTPLSAALWDSRVALLDAIYYNPVSK